MALMSLQLSGPKVCIYANLLLPFCIYSKGVISAWPSIELAVLLILSPLLHLACSATRT